MLLPTNRTILRRGASRTSLAMRVMVSIAQRPHKQAPSVAGSSRPNALINGRFGSSSCAWFGAWLQSLAAIALCRRARSDVRFCGTPPLVVTIAARSPGPIASTAASAIWRAMSIGRSAGIERSIRMKISRLVSLPVWLVATLCAASGAAGVIGGGPAPASTA